MFIEKTDKKRNPILPLSCEELTWLEMTCSAKELNIDRREQIEVMRWHMGYHQDMAWGTLGADG